jgi:hypothetical protein
MIDVINNSYVLYKTAKLAFTNFCLFRDFCWSSKTRQILLSAWFIRLFCFVADSWQVLCISASLMLVAAAQPSPTGRGPRRGSALFVYFYAHRSDFWLCLHQPYTAPQPLACLCQMLSYLQQMFPLWQHSCIASKAFLSTLPLPPPSPACLRGSEARLRPFLRVCTFCVGCDIDPSAIETTRQLWRNTIEGWHREQLCLFFTLFSSKLLTFAVFAVKLGANEGQRCSSPLVCLRLGCNSWPIQRWVSSGALEMARDTLASANKQHTPPTSSKLMG